MSTIPASQGPGLPAAASGGLSPANGRPEPELKPAPPIPPLFDTPFSWSPAPACREDGASARRVTPPQTPARRVRPGHGGDQLPRVSLRGTLEDLVAVAFLDDFAGSHDGHPVGEMPHHAQVMRNEQIGQAMLGLQVGQQVQHLGLDRHVQRRHGLVGHDEARLQRQRARDGDALALPAGKLVRIAPRVIRLQADPRQQRQHARLAFLGAAKLVDDHAVHDGVAHRATRVQAGIGILEDGLHLAAERQQRGAGQALHVMAGQLDAAGRGPQQAGDAAAQCALARARFADQRQRGAALDRQADAAHGLQHARRPAQQVAGQHEFLGHRVRAQDGVAHRVACAAVPRPSRRAGSRGASTSGTAASRACV